MVYGCLMETPLNSAMLCHNVHRRHFCRESSKQTNK